MCDSPAASNPFVWNLHRATMNGLVSGQVSVLLLEGHVVCLEAVLGSNAKQHVMNVQQHSHSHCDR